jgi:glycosyltransferase involved in cell wall biosynthesis
MIMKTLKIYYSSSEYWSHKRTADAYRQIIQNKYNLVTDINDVRSTDVIVLHHEPHDYGALYAQFPVLKDKYVIGYCVWEASDLPEPYKRSMQYVQEIWTASHYCYDVFTKYHPRVIYMPHLIDRNTDYSYEDYIFIKKAVGYEDGRIYYLSIAKLWDNRKNVRGLVEAFQKQSRRMPNARLIIKVLESERADFNSESQVIYLPSRLTESQINALYALSDIYVSAHHSEGWGLTLSDAMIFKKLVIATGYSGNLEFMNEDNSVLIDFTEKNIRPQDQYYLFDSGMKWAYPKQYDLERKLFHCYEGINESWVAEKKRKASAAIERFNQCEIDKLITRRLDEIMNLLASK